MSKRDLKKYLSELNKEQLENQMLDLYEKFVDVKVYFDFVFNPKEEKILQVAKQKITYEYFPLNGKKAKLRRSVSQKNIKHFIVLGVDSFLIADLMLFNIEVAQRYTTIKPIKSDSFYKSMLHSFEQAICYMIEKGNLFEFNDRIIKINEHTITQDWVNKNDFNQILERLSY